MNSSNYTINLLLKDNDLPAKIKSLQDNFDALSKSAETFSSQTTQSGLAITQTAQAATTLNSTLIALPAALSALSAAQEQLTLSVATSSAGIQQMQGVMDGSNLSAGLATGALAPYTDLMVQLIPLLDSSVSLIQNLDLAQKLASAGTRLLSGAQLVLNSVMSANPIPLIIVGLTALCAGLVAAYQNSQSFRDAVAPLVNWLKEMGNVILKFLAPSLAVACAAIAPLVSAVKKLLGIQDEATESTQKVAESTQQAAESTQQATEQTNKLSVANQDAVSSVAALSSAFGQQNQQMNLNLATIGGVEQKIAALRTAQKSASMEQAIALEQEIRLLEDKLNVMNNTLKLSQKEKPVLELAKAPEIPNSRNPKENDAGTLIIPDATPLTQITAGLTDARAEVQSFTESIWGSGSVIGQWADNATSGVSKITSIFGEFGTMLRDDTLSTAQQATGGLQAMGAMMGSMGGMIDGAAGSWLSWGANVLGAVASALPQLLELFGVECAVAAAGAASSVSSIPVVGWIMAGVAVASVLAALATIPKPKAFANGGIVYGNTFAQVGEYPGAANNPEVIAPLSKLKSMLNPQGFGEGGTVEFVIKGNRLVGVMNKESNKGRYF